MSQENQSPDRFNRRFKGTPRGRFTYVWIVGLLVILLSFLTDPDSGFIQSLPYGAGTVAMIIVLSRGVLYAALVHFSRKGLLDYFNGEEAWNKARQEPLSAAIYMCGVGLYTLALAVAIFAANYR